MFARQSGFTFIELLLYVALMSVLLFGISAFLMVFLEARVKNKTIAEVEQQGMQVMQILVQTIHNADSITLPAAGVSGTTLTLVTAGATNPTTVTLATNAIQLSEGGAAAVPLTNARVTASAFTAQNLSRPATPGVIRLQFTLTAVNPTKRGEYSYARTFIGGAALHQP